MASCTKVGNQRRRVLYQATWLSCGNGEEVLFRDAGSATVSLPCHEKQHGVLTMSNPEQRRLPLPPAGTATQDTRRCAAFAAVQPPPVPAELTATIRCWRPEIGLKCPHRASSSCVTTVVKCSITQHTRCDLLPSRRLLQ